MSVRLFNDKHIIDHNYNYNYNFKLYYRLVLYDIFLHIVLIMHLSVFLFLYSCILYFYDERCKMNFPVRDNTVLLYCIVLYLVKSCLKRCRVILVRFDNKQHSRVHLC